MQPPWNLHSSVHVRLALLHLHSLWQPLSGLQSYDTNSLMLFNEATNGYHPTSIPILQCLGTLSMVPSTVTRYGQLGMLLSERAVTVNLEWGRGYIFECLSTLWKQVSCCIIHDVISACYALHGYYMRTVDTKLVFLAVATVNELNSREDAQRQTQDLARIWYWQKYPVHSCSLYCYAPWTPATKSSTSDVCTNWLSCYLRFIW